MKESFFLTSAPHNKYEYSFTVLRDLCQHLTLCDDMFGHIIPCFPSTIICTSLDSVHLPTHNVVSTIQCCETVLTQPSDNRKTAILPDSYHPGSYPNQVFKFETRISKGLIPFILTVKTYQSDHNQIKGAAQPCFLTNQITTFKFNHNF